MTELSSVSYKYIIDSSAWVEYLGGTELGNKIKTIIEQKQIATSIIAITELADKFARESKAFDISLRFIQGRATILPITVPISLKAALLKNELRSKRPKFGIVDAIHLATATKENAVLLTTDNDFAGVENVLLV